MHIHAHTSLIKAGLAICTFRFRFSRIAARRLKITKFTANRKNIKVKYNRQQDNTMQSYSRLQCSPVFCVAAGPVVLITYPADLPQQNNKTTNTLTQYRRGKWELN